MQTSFMLPSNGNPLAMNISYLVKITNALSSALENRWSRFAVCGLSDSPQAKKRIQGPFLSHLEASPKLGKSGR